MPGRLNRVEVLTAFGVVSLTWEERVAPWQPSR